MGRTVVQLGRLGDIINILPVMEEWNRQGNRGTLMVSAEFEHILDGVGYIDRISWAGDYKYINPALMSAQKRDPRATSSQIWSLDQKPRRTQESFQRESWHRVGMRHRWDQMPLVFDHRDRNWESDLVRRVLGGCSNKPTILVNTGGHSSPLPTSATDFLEELNRRLGNDFEILDITAVRAERVYDLLGLFDRASCLITADTSTLHLAQASSVPVISLVNNETWLAGERRTNHLVRMKYKKIDFDVIQSAAYSIIYPIGKLIHAYPMYDMSPDDARRVEIAHRAWMAEYNLEGGWMPRPVWNEKELPRTSRKTLRDTRDVPFVKDVLDLAFEEAGDNDAVVLTNTDVGFTPGMTRSLRRLLACKGAAYGYRFDFDQITHPLSYHQTVSGKSLGGLDIFAFTKTWWIEHRNEAPDMVMGCTHWDLVYRDLVKKHGGGELYGGIWHELHGSFWKVNPRTPGNLHNINLSDQWTMLNDPTKIFKNLERDLVT